MDWKNHGQMLDTIIKEAIEIITSYKGEFLRNLAEYIEKRNK